MVCRRFSLFFLFAFAFSSIALAQGEKVVRSVGSGTGGGSRRPIETVLQRGASTTRDLRTLPKEKPKKRERPEREGPKIDRIELGGGPRAEAAAMSIAPNAAAAPAPSASFSGLDFNTWGAGHPPDTVGDVGPLYYIQAINSSIGIFNKTTGAQVAAFTFDTFMSQGNFGNLCDTDNFGDPVILYDSFEDRWIITDFAFMLSGGAVVSPPGAFQCFAVSKTGDPVSGGWNFYSLPMPDALNDYPKLGIWPDGIYMSSNMFAFPAGGAFQGVRVWALNKAQMYAGAPTVQVVRFDAGTGDFTVLPANARLQTGTPPAGTPNFFVSSWNFLNALTVYKFHVDWSSISLSTFTGPDTPLAATSWPNAAVANAPQSGTATLLDVLQIRAMMQNQYTNIGGVESLWMPHTVRRANTTGFAAPRWYQVNVTGGTVAATLPQAATWDPDAANVMHRFMPSLAVNRAGDLAIGYSTSSSTTKPAIKYAGRLAADPVNTFSQTEQLLIQGLGAQTTTARWGDYSAMTLDPDGCTFWYTNEYYAVDGANHQTQIGSFAYPSCTAAGAGTLSGTVTATVGGAPIVGATLSLGSRTATTDIAGFYSFTNLPAGTYPSETASAAGYNSSTAFNLAVLDATTTTQDYTLDTAPLTACITDTTQADFQQGVPNNTDLVTAPGDVMLTKPNNVDQKNETVTNSGFGFNSTAWAGQTFQANLTGQLTKLDLDLFCSGCTGTTPNLTVSIRATTGSPAVPTGADLATATIPGFNSGAGGYFTATFATPTTVTSGTTYAIVVRATANPSAGTYAYVCSCTSPNSNPYALGQRVTSANSGVTWAADVTSGGRDLGFHVYINQGYSPNGDLVSALADSNPPPAYSPLWTTLSWNAAVPGNTNLQYQVAASSSEFGPFNFVGPDNTAATFFTTSGASLGQFNGNRYLRYKAYLVTADGTVTPAVNDVTVCFDSVQPDVGITKTDGLTTAVPGGAVVYTITASNLSAAPATGATVADTFPASLTCTWTCVGAGGGTCTAAGAGSINDTVNLPAGGSVTYTATCAVSASATGSLSNTATVAAAGDSNAANDSATDIDTLTPQADLAITKTNGVTTATPGGSVTYTITASNAGPSDAPGSTVGDTFPASLTCTWTCVGAGGGTCTASGSGNINNDTVNLPAGGSVTYTASCSISAAATGSLSNTATTSAAGGVTDPTPGNNSATDTDTLAASADLSITKTDGVTTATAGGSTTYTITASNAGPSDASGSQVADTFPASLTCTWTCVGAGGGTCTASGSGNINNDIVNLPAGGSVTYTASCAISAAATGSLSNTATTTAAGGVTDPNPGNNSVTDVDALGASADLAITKTDGVTTATPGGSVTYTITASNAGPSDASGSTVADTFPASLTCTWTCVGAGGGTCTASGSGNINNDVVNLPAGGSVTYTASCTISAAASGTLSNTATATAPGGVTDPNPGNNSATDSDTLGATADLSITKTDSVTTATPGGSVTYTITTSNAGPSDATGSTVADTFPATLTCTWTCVGAGGGTCTASGSGNISDTVNLPAGGSVTYTASCTVSAAATGSLVNTATAAAPAGVTDPNPANNSATDSDTLPPPPGAAVTATKTVSGSFVIGGSVTYTVVLNNGGPGAQADNPGNEFTDVLPAGLALVSANATSGSAVATVATNTVTWNGTIPASGSVTITIQANILPAAAGSTVSNQGTAFFDGDADGSNESSAATDDPGTPATGDATSFAVAPAVAEIPELDWRGMAVLVLLLSAIGVWWVQRR